jgi:hypothetical protein
MNGVRVGVKVTDGVRVAVGGIGVIVAVWEAVGVQEGVRVAVRVKVRVEVRVRVGGIGVSEGGMGVGGGSVRVGRGVLVRNGVAVPMQPESGQIKRGAI